MESMITQGGETVLQFLMENLAA